MDHVQKYLAEANRQIAELTAQIARQRVVVKQALNTGHCSEMAESLRDALERSLRIFENRRIFLLNCSSSSSAMPTCEAAMGRSFSRP
jgi:ketosteroid isomerase-like protein